MRSRAGVSLLWFVMPLLGKTRGKVSTATALENFRCRSFDAPVKTCHLPAALAGVFGCARSKLQLHETVKHYQIKDCSSEFLPRKVEH